MLHQVLVDENESKAAVYEGLYLSQYEKKLLKVIKQTEATLLKQVLKKM